MAMVGAALVGNLEGGGDEGVERRMGGGGRRCERGSCAPVGRWLLKGRRRGKESG